MRKIFLYVLLIVLAFSAYAGDMHSSKMKQMHEDMEFLHDEMSAVMDRYSDRPIGEMTFSEMEEMQGEISIVQQKMFFVHKSKIASFIKPGAGQFINGEKGAGALFLTADLVLFAGKLVGTYFMLPAELQFDQIDYFNDSYTSIKAGWESMSFMDLLPAVGVMAGASLLQTGLRAISSKQAGRLAVETIKSGSKSFEAHISPMPFKGGMMGMGMHISLP